MKPAEGMSEKCNTEYAVTAVQYMGKNLRLCINSKSQYFSKQKNT